MIKNQPLHHSVLFQFSSVVVVVVVRFVVVRLFVGFIVNCCFISQHSAPICVVSSEIVSHPTCHFSFLVH
jgi:hypothetical protein